MRDTSAERLGTIRNKRERESGIELLRIVAMLLIVSHHMVVHNTFQVAVEPMSARRLVLQQFLCTPGKIGIALFFMISAWFMVDRVPTTRSVFRKAWIMERELLFWSLLIFIMQIMRDSTSITIDTVITALFPMSRNLWWYATTYMIFLLLSPFLIQGLRSLGKKRHMQCCLVMIFLWGVLYLVPASNTNINMNVVGFVYVFTLIAYYKWYMAPLSLMVAWALALGGTVLIVIWDVAVTVGLNVSPIKSEILSMVEREWSIPILAVSLGMFALFHRMHFHSIVVNRCAAATFGVYLITDHPFMRNLLWNQWFDISRIYHSHSCLGVCARCCIAVLSVFVAAMLLDMLRSMLFSFTVDKHEGYWSDVVWGLFSRMAIEEHGDDLRITTSEKNSVSASCR